MPFSRMDKIRNCTRRKMVLRQLLWCRGGNGSGADPDIRVFLANPDTVFLEEADPDRIRI